MFTQPGPTRRISVGNEAFAVLPANKQRAAGIPPALPLFRPTAATLARKEKRI